MCDRFSILLGGVKIFSGGLGVAAVILKTLSGHSTDHTASTHFGRELDNIQLAIPYPARVISEPDLRHFVSRYVSPARKASSGSSDQGPKLAKTGLEHIDLLELFRTKFTGPIVTYPTLHRPQPASAAHIPGALSIFCLGRFVAGSGDLHRLFHRRFVEGRHGRDFSVTLFRVPDAESEHNESVRRFDDIDEIINALGIVDGLEAHPQLIRLVFAGLEPFVLTPKPFGRNGTQEYILHDVSPRVAGQNEPAILSHHRWKRVLRAGTEMNPRDPALIQVHFRPLGIAACADLSPDALARAGKSPRNGSRLRSNLRNFSAYP